MTEGLVEVDFEYMFAAEVMCYAQSVIWEFPEEFEHLIECDIGFLFTGLEMKVAHQRKSAVAMIPQAMGQGRRIFFWMLKQFFGRTPDALVVVVKEDWDEITPEQKVALIYHELSHLVQKEGMRGPSFDRETGKPILDIKDHDVEEFYDVVEKFGNWHAGLNKLRIRAAQDDGKVASKTLEKIFSQSTLLLELFELNQKGSHIGWIEQKALEFKQEVKKETKSGRQKK